MFHPMLERVAKHSFLYSYMISQPFATYVDAYPVLDHKILLEAQQLQYSEHGEAVRVLQEKLNHLEYYDDDIDSEFGVLTEHALKKFQENHGLTVSGQADSETIQTIVKEEIELYIDKLIDLSGSIHPAMAKEDVEIVQQTLSYFGYYDGNIDGIYGPLTQKAVEMLESEYDLDLVSEDARQSLRKLYEEEKERVDQTMEEEQTEEAIEQNNQTSKQESEEAEMHTTEEKAEKASKKIETKTNNTNVVEVAHSLVGTPYEWGGDSPDGFDCSGFVQFVYETQDKTVPRTVSDMWNFATPVDEPSIGDLVFFETYQAGPSHMGIYVGDDKFIHAGESNGVAIGELSESYWQERYLGAKRIR